MNKKQLAVLWLLALWLAFSVLYSSYYPPFQHTVTDNSKGLDFERTVTEPGGFQFGIFLRGSLVPPLLIPMTFPAILLWLPLHLTLGYRRKADHEL
jgi:hypothetical protein